MGSKAFADLPDGAVALVTIEALSSFGENGTNWNGLTVSMSASYLNELSAKLTELSQRPTAEQLANVEAERDARPTQTAYDTAVAASRVAGQGDVTSTPASYNLTTSEAYNTIVAERDGRFVDTDADGITDVKEAELETDSAEETIFYLQDAYDSAVAASRLSGQGDVTADPATFALTTLAAYNGMVAQKNIAITTLNTTVGANIVEIDELKELIETRNNTIILNTTTIESLNETITQKDAAYDTMVAERDARPTLATYNTAVANSRVAGQADVTDAPDIFELFTTPQYNAIVADRDARFTEDQIYTMSVDHTVGKNEAGNMQVEIAFIQSADLNTYTPFTVPLGALSVVNGKICMEFPPSDEQNFFFRFRLE